jgi:hypothetical protein
LDGLGLQGRCGVFFASGVAPFIVGQPLQKATALFQEEADSGAQPRRPLPDILCSP